MPSAVSLKSTHGVRDNGPHPVAGTVLSTDFGFVLFLAFVSSPGARLSMKGVNALGGDIHGVVLLNIVCLL